MSWILANFLGIMFVFLILMMLLIGKLRPLKTPWVQQYTGEVNLTPWKFAVPVATVLVILVITIYAAFADFSVLSETVPETPAQNEAAAELLQDFPEYPDDPGLL